MNRILTYLDHSRCGCCKLRERLNVIRAECLRIEKLAGGVLEFVVPSGKEMLRGKKKIMLWLKADFDRASVDDDLAAFTVIQLRALSRELATAADAVEGGAA